MRKNIEIPSERRVKWNTAGHNGSPTNNLPETYDSTIMVPSPGKNDYFNIKAAINKAKALAGNGSNRIRVQLQKGTYRIRQTIYMDFKHQNIVIQGKGASATILKYQGPKSKSANIFYVKGKITENKTNIQNFNKKLNMITLTNTRNDISKGDYVFIQLPNGDWHDTVQNNTEDNYVSQIVKVTRVNKKQLTLEDDFSITWEIAKSDDNQITPFLQKIIPIQNIGIEHMTLEKEEIPYKSGIYLRFDLTVNSWVKGVKSIKPVHQHINVRRSLRLEVRENEFRDAVFHGTGGSGYGIALRRSSFCLIENNVFWRLRHAVMIARGANRNVIGYNYSYNQFDNGGKAGKHLMLSCINLHGFYPYANLIEGNWVEEIHADKWWGSNGPYNTIFRNFTSRKQIILEQTNKANILANHSGLIIMDSFDLLHAYDNEKKQLRWRTEDTKVNFHPYISLYHSSRPVFIDSSYSWPPIGPPIQPGDTTVKQNIPARQRELLLLKKQ